MPLADRVDVVAISVFVIVLLVVELTLGQWIVAVVFGAALANVSAYAMRRRAGVPDRSPLGRWRARRASR